MNQCDIKQIFDYKDGELVWKTPVAKRIKIGDIAGSIDDQGYKRVTINYKSYKIHRLIFFYHYNWFPEEVDHIDGDRLNNKIQNLRPSTKTQNQWNSKKPNRNTSGFKNVSWSKANKKWHVGILKNGEYLGRKYFKDIDDAKKYAIELRLKLHGEFSRNE